MHTYIPHTGAQPTRYMHPHTHICTHIHTHTHNTGTLCILSTYTKTAFLPHYAHSTHPTHTLFNACPPHRAHLLKSLPHWAWSLVQAYLVPSAGPLVGAPTMLCVPTLCLAHCSHCVCTPVLRADWESVTSRNLGPCSPCVFLTWAMLLSEQHPSEWQ
jgi:hypothetical protein